MAEMTKIIMYNKQEMKMPYYIVRFADKDDNVTEWIEPDYDAAVDRYTGKMFFIGTGAEKGILELMEVTSDDSNKRTSKILERISNLWERKKGI